MKKPVKISLGVHFLYMALSDLFFAKTNTNNRKAVPKMILHITVSALEQGIFVTNIGSVPQISIDAISFA
jgi:hypothetical protein